MQFGRGEDAAPAALFGGFDRLRVEELEDRRVHARAHQGGRGFERAFIGPAGQQERAAGLGLVDELERGLGDHPEGPLGADPEVAEVESADELTERRPPGDLLAGREESLERVDVVADHAVLGGAEATGVRGDVAADAAVFQRRRIGREEEPVFGGELVDAGRDGARLDRRHRRNRVDLDLIPVVEVDDPATADRRARAGVAGAAAADGDGDLVFVGELQDDADVVFDLRADDRLGHEGQAHVVEGSREARGFVGLDLGGAEAGEQGLRGRRMGAYGSRHAP